MFLTAEPIFVSIRLVLGHYVPHCCNFLVSVWVRAQDVLFQKPMSNYMLMLFS